MLGWYYYSQTLKVKNLSKNIEFDGTNFVETATLASCSLKTPLHKKSVKKDFVFGKTHPYSQNISQYNSRICQMASIDSFESQRNEMIKTDCR